MALYSIRIRTPEWASGLDAGPSLAGDDRSLDAEQTAGIRSALDIREGSFAVRLVGKDGTVKLASATVVPMAEIYHLIDGMPMRQRELQDR
jgi:hypothetical protein